MRRWDTKPYATAPVVTSRVNPRSSGSLKRARFAVRLIRKLNADGPRRVIFIIKNSANDSLREVAETRLRQWVQRSGEEEVKAAAYISKGLKPFSFHERRPLTVDDYFQEEELEQLRERWLERQLQAQERRKQEWQQRKKAAEERRQRERNQTEWQLQQEQNREQQDQKQWEEEQWEQEQWEQEQWEQEW